MQPVDLYIHERKLPIIYVDNGVADFLPVGDGFNQLESTEISELKEKLKKKICRVLIVRWSGFSVLARTDNGLYIGTDNLCTVIEKIRAIIDELRNSGKIDDKKIKLIISSRAPILPKDFSGAIHDYSEAHFLARRIVLGRNDNSRTVTYLSKDKQQGIRLRRELDNSAHYENIDAKVEDDIRDITSSLDTRQYPDFIRLNRSLVHTKFVDDYGSVDDEDDLGETSLFMRRAKVRRPKAGIVRGKDGDEILPLMLSRLSKGRSIVSFYGVDCLSLWSLCELQLNVPEAIKRCIEL